MEKNLCLGSSACSQEKPILDNWRPISLFLLFYLYIPNRIFNSADWGRHGDTDKGGKPLPPYLANIIILDSHQNETLGKPDILDTHCKQFSIYVFQKEI